MKPKGIRMTPLETKVLAWSQLSKQRIIRSGELSKILGINPQQEEKLLIKMNKSGIIIRLNKGLYLLPGTIPTAPWSASEYFLLSILMEELDAKYQVTGLAAFRFHKLSTQIPNQITVYNTKISGVRKIGIVNFNFIKVSSERIGAYKEIEVKDFASTRIINIGSLARTIVDAIYDYKRFASLPDAYDWIRERANDEIFLKELVEVTLNFSNISTCRRIGYFLESIKANPRLVNKIYKNIDETSSFIPMYPELVNRGKISRKWGVKINGAI